MEMLRVSHISKQFGSQHVIKDLSFSVEEHRIYGFIGENGAGKTTTMKMILGLYQADGGEIWVNGEKVHYGQNQTNRYIGYLPDVPEFYGYMTPVEYMTLCGEISKMSAEQMRREIPELLELVGLEQVKKRIHGFSRGMKQRLGVAQALLGSPKLLICDEPTSALDPLGRKEILDILLSLRDRTTVLFSTHILSDVERICDEVGFLHGGTIALQGKMDEICGIGHSQGFDLEFLNTGDTDRFAGLRQGGQRIGNTQLFYPGKGEEDLLEAMNQLVNQGIPIRRIEMREPSLETLFMEVIGK